MQINVRAFALTIGILWGANFLLLGILIHLFPNYGETWIQLWVDVYPLYEGSGSVLDTFIGTAFGLVDGTLGGAVVAWLYNRIARKLK